MSSNELTFSQSPLQARSAAQSGAAPASLADILERVLDKGIVIAGDIQINLLDIELLTIKLRLLVASVDRAREMGINWWEGDTSLSSGAARLEQENRSLRDRLERLERAAGLPAGDGDSESTTPRGAGDGDSESAARRPAGDGDTSKGG